MCASWRRKRSSIVRAVVMCDEQRSALRTLPSMEQDAVDLFLWNPSSALQMPHAMCLMGWNLLHE